MILLAEQSGIIMYDLPVTLQLVLKGPYLTFSCIFLSKLPKMVMVSFYMTAFHPFLLEFTSFFPVFSKIPNLCVIGNLQLTFLLISW